MEVSGRSRTEGQRTSGSVTFHDAWTALRTVASTRDSLLLNSYINMFAFSSSFGKVTNLFHNQL